MADHSKSEITMIKNDPKEYTEDEILELYRSADNASRQAARFVLKCDKPQLGDVMSLLSSVMEDADTKGKKAADALAALSVLLKNKGIDPGQIQAVTGAAAALLNNSGSSQSADDQDTSDNPR